MGKIKKYQNGDKVRLRRDLIRDIAYRMKHLPSRSSGCARLENRMLPFLGKIVTIRTESNWWCYNIEEADGHVIFVDEMFEEINRKEN